MYEIDYQYHIERHKELIREAENERLIRKLKKEKAGRKKKPSVVLPKPVIVPNRKPQNVYQQKPLAAH